MKTWSLDTLYLGFDDPKLESDLNKINELVKTWNEFALEFMNENSPCDKDVLTKALNYEIELGLILRKFGSFIHLSSAVDVSNKEASTYQMKMMNLSSSLAYCSVLYTKYVSRCDITEFAKDCDLIKEHEFYLKEIQNGQKHSLLPNEALIQNKLTQNGSKLWGEMVGYLTSTLEVKYDKKKIPLSAVRNLAYEADSSVRLAAYKAELKAYKSIEDSMSFALSAIKGEAINVADITKYSSVLDKTLEDSRLTKKTLDSLITAMKEFLPDFRSYLKQKAKLLGHKNGLPWYDLFAPMGSCDKTYEISEAKEFIETNFKSFSDDLKDLATCAFDNNWIDFTPRSGKRGGAFCAGIPTIKESRILTNYTGGIGDVSTLAHELGHAYHNEQIFNESYLNCNCTMPVAETASILCETIVKKAVYDSSTSKEEKLGILEQELQDSTQVIVDILSRYIFETNVIEKRKVSVLNANELNTLMKEAQLESYGDGLDPKYLNEGMWICKGHYYNAGNNFYNFPYAFGLLFAKAIYKKFKEEGKAFVPAIKTLLRNTGKMTVEDAALSIGIDISDINFWRSSLTLIKEDIEEFINLTN